MRRVLYQVQPAEIAVFRAVGIAPAIVIFEYLLGC